MIIFPAIDIKDGRCVRLTQGKFDQVSIYNDNPAEVARLWESMGSQYIHLVDLDGAKDGSPASRDMVKKVIDAVDIPVQVGGGIRSLERAGQLIALGARRIILGTAAVYIEAYETITGQRFTLPEGEGSVLDRVRANLRPYFTR